MNSSDRTPGPGANGRTPKNARGASGDTSAGAEASGTSDAWAIVSYQMAGITVWGGIGWLLDRWTGHTALFLPIGVIVGIVGALFLIFSRITRS